MTSDEIREAFLHFFEDKGHQRVSSSPLVPHGDPTLLLTTAGMVQFKRYFTGEETPPHPRLTSCQKCFRRKDIESVGDSKHLTFFEMLGNFSIGDYFKREAIEWAWEFVAQRLGLPLERLWFTVFLDDDEAFACWREVGVPQERILRFGEEDNFWGPAGDTGPCGPCSEIHYDLGPGIGCGRAECGPGCECGRFVEIWNLVFTQYDQQSDGRRLPLPKPNIDTGMGLERMAAVMQGKTSVYETDLFAPLIELLSRLCGKSYGKDEATDLAMRTVVEHARAVTFLIGDGVVPSKYGRGNVLRRVFRRAALFGSKLGLEEPFLGELAKTVVSLMGHEYPGLVRGQEFILNIIEAEEYQSDQTLDVGIAVLYGICIQQGKELLDCLQSFEANFIKALSASGIDALRRDLVFAINQFRRCYLTPGHVLMVGGRDAIKEKLEPVEAGLNTLEDIIEGYQSAKYLEKWPGRPLAGLKEDLKEGFEQLKATVESVARRLSGFEVFILHDTYGLDKEITTEIAAENGLSVDLEGFEHEMERQRERARAARKVTVSLDMLLVRGSKSQARTDFVGYEALRYESPVDSIWLDDESLYTASEGQEVDIVLEKTPFYGEMGGQVGDTGEIRGEKGRVIITNTLWPSPDLIVHQGKVVEGMISVGDAVEAVVDEARRLDIARNHTATHLLQAALRQVLGTQVQQSGSLVAPDRLRFDFTQISPVTREQLLEVQRIVNERVRQDLPVKDRMTTYKEAIAEGVLAFFGEKYGEEVRVLEIGDPVISAELCGGTHVASTGEIGLFLIVDESSIGAGMRRIEAVSGRGAEKLVEERFSILEEAAQELQAPATDMQGRIADLRRELDAERKRAIALERELSKGRVESLLKQAESVADIAVLAARVPASNMESLRHMGDLVKEHLGSVVVVLGAVYGDQANFVAMVTPDLTARGLNAGEIVKKVAAAAGGRGGGRAEMGQGGGKDKEKLDDALKLVRSLVEEAAKGK